MARALRVVLAFCGLGLGAQLLLGLVALAAPALLDAGLVGPALQTDAHFFSALLSPLVALLALLSAGLGLAGRSFLLGDEHRLATRALWLGAALLVVTCGWFVLSIGLFGGGLIPH